MGRSGRMVAILACLCGQMLLAGCGRERPGREAQSRQAVPVAGITVTSEAFGDGQVIPRRHTGDGEDLSPPLSWSSVPSQAKELVLVCDDPDAPGGNWVHWVLYRIPAETTSLAEGASSVKAGKSPAGMVEGKTSWGRPGYQGPSPPPGKVHHYRFRLYALDAPLYLPAGVDWRAVEKALAGHVIAQGELVGTYRR